LIAKGIVGRPVTHFLDGGAEPAEQVDSVAVEEPLEIRVATEPVAITMRTPGDDAQLALGFLFAEGIIRSIDEVGAVSHCGRPGDEGFDNVIDVTAAPGVSLDVEKVQAARRGTLTTSACGVCGRRSVDDLLSLCGQVPPGPPLSSHLVASATERLRQAQMNFARTGGVHAAAALDAQGTVLAVYEDVGRHNAVDKVVGALLQTRSVTAESSLRSAARPSAEVRSKPTLLVVSGRASFEILQKATMARIALVASVSAPSSLAIDLAHRCGITLAGFVRGGGFNVYTHPERLVAEAR
jgi:FdhD protein